MRITVGGALRLTTELLTAVGCPGEGADDAARALVTADAWGSASHGLLRLPWYLDRARAGGLTMAAEPQVTMDTGPFLRWAGGGGFGLAQVAAATRAAAARARTHGVAVVAVEDSNHCGALGVHAATVAREGVVAVVLSDGPAAMPPWDGDRAVLSTSPIAAAFPTSPRPILVDLATTAVARGRVAAAAAEGSALEPGWAYAADGAPTLDPQEALRGMLAPLGGAKGFALAVAVEALTAGLVGPTRSEHIPDFFSAEAQGEPQGIAHLVLCLDPAIVDPSGRAGARWVDLGISIQDAGGRVPGWGKPTLDELGPDHVLELAPTTAQALRVRCAQLEVTPAPDSS